MSTERIGSGVPASAPSDAGAVRETPSEGDKTSPSAFDRVMEKQDSPDRDGDSGGPGAGKGERGPRAAGEGEKELPLRDLSAFFHFRAQTMERTPAVEPVKVEKTLPRPIVDEVVQAVRVGVNRLGDKEMQFDMKSNVMDGMRIRVSMHENRVTTILEVATLDARQKLEAQLGELAQALEHKGLKVAELNVEFKEPQRSDTGSDQRQRRWQQQQEEESEENPSG